MIAVFTFGPPSFEQQTPTPFGQSATHAMLKARRRDEVNRARPYADPEAAARKLVEIASTIEPVQNGRIYIELVNAPFLKAGGSGDEFRAGIDSAIAKGWLVRHESGTYVRFTESGSALFA
jgi:hypothetical protein